MAGTSELKRLWRKYREYRITKKQRRLSQATSSGSSSRDSKDVMMLDDAAIAVVGLGLDSKQEVEEEYIEDMLDDEDPRFIGNSYGIGCSRTYEEPYNGVFHSISTSPASVCPIVPQDTDLNEGDRPLSFPNLGPSRLGSIDRVKGKRKGRMPGDSPDDRFKNLLDGPASRGKFFAKRFPLVR